MCPLLWAGFHPWLCCFSSCPQFPHCSPAQPPSTPWAVPHHTLQTCCFPNLTPPAPSAANQSPEPACFVKRHHSASHHQNLLIHKVFSTHLCMFSTLSSEPTPTFRNSCPSPRTHTPLPGSCVPPEICSSIIHLISWGNSLIKHEAVSSRDLT